MTKFHELLILSDFEMPPSKQTKRFIVKSSAWDTIKNDAFEQK